MAVRLPNPGSDDGQWGEILNDYLSQSHTPQGALKPGTVGASQLADATITEVKLAVAVRDKLNAIGSGGATNLSVTSTTTSTTVVSSTGTDALIPAATTNLAGVMSSADKTKLNAVAANATANSSDATLLDRTNHTGVQAISSVTGLQTALTGKVTGLNGAAGLWIGTQAQYDAIASPVPTTLYVINGA